MQKTVEVRVIRRNKLEAKQIRSKKELLKNTTDKLTAYRIRTRIARITGSLGFEFEGRVICKHTLGLMNSILVITTIDFDEKVIYGRLRIDFMISVSRDYQRRRESKISNARRGRK